MPTDAIAGEPLQLYSISDVRRFSLPVYRDARGELIPSRADCLPGPLMRVFFVLGRDGAVRGEHAHKTCTQAMICIVGRVAIRCTDGSDDETFDLAAPGDGLLVPPTIWSNQVFTGESPMMAVLCDQEYDADEYIRDWDAFVTFRGQA